MIRTILVILFFPLALNSQEVWDLEKCINFAIENNLSLQKEGLNIDFAKKQSKQTKLNYYPSLNSSATHEYNWGQRIDPFTNQFATKRVRSNSFYLSSTLVLFSGMQNYYLTKQAGENINIQKVNKKIKERNLKIDVASGYLKLLLNQEILLVNREQKLITESQLIRVEELVKAGRKTKAEVIEIKSRLAKNELQILQAKNEIELVKIDFYSLLNLPDSITLIFEKANISSLNDSLFNITSLEVDLANLEIEQTETKIKIEESKKYPSLSLYGSVGTGYSGNNQELNDNGEIVAKSFGVQINENLYQNISLNLSIPIFNNGKNNLYVQQAIINKKEAVLNKEITKVDFWNKIDRLKIDVSNTRNEIESAIIALELAEISKENSLVLFNNGRANNFEFQESVNNLFVAKSNLLQLKYELYFKKLLLNIYSE